MKEYPIVYVVSYIGPIGDRVIEVYYDKEEAHQVASAARNDYGFLKVQVDKREVHR